MASRTLSVVLLVISIVSLTLVVLSASAAIQANDRLEKILDIEPAEIPSPTRPPALDIDDQILEAQDKLRIASNRIRTRKVQVGWHAHDAIRAIDRSGEGSLREARAILADIAKNAEAVVQRNEEIESEMLRLNTLYQRKIETILAAKEAQQEASLDVRFWAGFLGLLATISGMILAWRKDRLDHHKDRRELRKLQHDLANA